MHLFSFLIFPAVIFYMSWTLYKKGGVQALRERTLIFIAGGLCGLALCSVFEFFIFPAEYAGNNIAFFALIKWLFTVVIPSVFFVLFILWSNDSWEMRMGNYFWFILPLYAFYNTYTVFTDSMGFSFFMLFVQPVLSLLLVFVLAKDLAKFWEYFKAKNKLMIVCGIVFVIESFIPSFIQSLWYNHIMFFVWFPAALLFCAYCTFRALPWKNLLDE